MTTVSTPTETPFDVFVEEFNHTACTLRVLLNFCKRRAQPNGDVWSTHSYPLIRESVREGFPVVAPDATAIGTVASCVDLGANEFEIVVELDKAGQPLLRSRGYVKVAFWGDVTHRHTQGDRGSLTICPLEMVLWKQDYASKT